mmetsp:Transcript_9751/g.17589  ORF Transcript_9751/g.17589 Transcript_9751/m.17589 type:complete len:311 (+) Transcript_9751:3-935(+)
MAQVLAPMASDTLDRDEVAKAIVALLSQAPAGHLQEVAASCRRLLSASIPAEELDAAIANGCQQALEDQHAVVWLPSGSQGLVTKTGNVRDTTYLNPGAEPASVYMVSHVDQQCLREELAGDACQQNSAAEPFRKALEVALGKYMQDSYAAENRRVASAVYASETDGNVELNAFVTSQHWRPSACWSGSWNSHWHLRFKIGKEADPLSLLGELSFRSTYTEDANVSFHRSESVRESVRMSRPEELADAITNIIHVSESSFQMTAEQDCTTFGGSALKAVRRALPLSKERFDWRPLRHDLLTDLQRADIHM